MRSNSLGFIMVVCFFLLSCATPHQIQKEGGLILDVGYYTIEAPSGEGWIHQIYKERGVVTCTKEKQFMGQVQKSTLIQVSRNELEAQSWHMGEKEVADDFRNREEKVLKKMEYEVKDVRKETTTINGKTVYTMSYKATAGTFFGGMSPKGPFRATEAVLYLYFPLNFGEKHSFYCFLIREYYLRPSPFKVDLTQVYSVIRSFRETGIKEWSSNNRRFNLKTIQQSQKSKALASFVPRTFSSLSTRNLQPHSICRCEDK